MANPPEQGLINEETTVHDLVFPHIRDFIDNLSTTQEKVLNMAHQTESFPLDPNTATFVANLAHAQMKGLNTLKSEYQDHVRNLDIQVGQALRTAKQSQQIADDKARALEIQTKTSRDVQIKGSQTLEDYNKSVKALSELHTRFDLVFPQLKIAQDNAGIQEKVVMGLKEKMQEFNANHVATLQKMQDQYARAEALLQQEKAEAETNVLELEKKARNLQDDIDDLKNRAGNAADYAESVAVQMAVERANQLSDNRFEIDKAALQKAHEGEIRRLNEAHQVSLNTYQANTRKEHNENKNLAAKLADLEQQKSNWWSHRAAVSMETDARKQEYIELAQQLWDGHQRKFIDSSFSQFQVSVKKHLHKVSQDLGANKARTEQVLQMGESWDTRVNKFYKGAEHDLAVARAVHTQNMKATVSELRGYLAETKNVLVDGAAATQTIGLAKKYLETAYKALDILRDADQYRDKADTRINEHYQELQALNRQLEDQARRINELTQELNASQEKCAETDKLRKEVADLKSMTAGTTQAAIKSLDDQLKVSRQTIDDLNKELKHESRARMENEKLLRDLREDLIGKVALIEDLRKRLTKLGEEIDQHKADQVAAGTRDKTQSENAQQELARTKKLLDDCNAHKGDNDFKAKEYDKLVSPYEEINKLKEQVTQLQQRPVVLSGSQGPSASSLARQSTRIPQSTTSRGLDITDAPPFNLPTRGARASAGISLGSQSPSTFRRSRNVPTSPSIRSTDTIFTPPQPGESGSPSGLPQPSRSSTPVTRSTGARPSTIPTQLTTRPSTPTLIQPSTAESEQATAASTAPGGPPESSQTGTSATVLGKRGVERTPIDTPAHLKYAAGGDRSRVGVPRDTRPTSDPATGEFAIAGPNIGHPTTGGFATGGTTIGEPAPGSSTGQVTTGEVITVRDFATQHQTHAGTAPQDTHSTPSQATQEQQTPITEPSSAAHEEEQITEDIDLGFDLQLGMEDDSLEVELPTAPTEEEVDTSFDLGDDHFSSDPTDSSRPTGRRPGETDWRRPGVDGEDRPSIVFSQIVKPANWNERINRDLIHLLVHSGRRFPSVNEDFLASPLCMPSHLTHVGKSKTIQVDQTEPCDNCKEKKRRCWGLKILPDTSPDARSFKKKQRWARTAYTTNIEGHYWEAIYRPGSGPDDDDDMTGGGDEVNA